jgi:hypothetical protein
MILGLILLTGWLLIAAVSVFICIRKRRGQLALLLGFVCLALPCATIAAMIFGLPSSGGNGFGVAFAALVCGAIVAATTPIGALVVALSAEDRRPR